MLTWVQRSGVAHTLKDLEKALPSVGSVSSMQVKEYVQAMLDENELTVEKIGSGNWYWSFPGAELMRKQTSRNVAREDRDRMIRAVEEARQRLEEWKVSSGIDDTEEKERLLEARADMEASLNEVRTELDLFSKSDPVELEIMKSKIEQAKAEAEKFTEQIETMMSWLKSKVYIDRETLAVMQKEWYGDEFDDEHQGLRELM
jgi:Mnd1 HTH domain